jgi:hypothetical protein
VARMAGCLEALQAVGVVGLVGRGSGRVRGVLLCQRGLAAGRGRVGLQAVARVQMPVWRVSPRAINRRRLIAAARVCSQ